MREETARATTLLLLFWLDALFFFKLSHIINLFLSNLDDFSGLIPSLTLAQNTSELFSKK